MIKQISITQYLADANNYATIDVRSPAEYAHGHIQGACNVPLFSNEERAQVGITYKHDGPEAALHLGLEIVGPNLNRLLEQARTCAGSRKVALYCWRGGQRSSSVAWLLDFAGLDTTVITGGYKAYRREIKRYMGETRFSLLVLGGYTGSAKTAILHELENLGEQIIDIEGLANHKGSAFGWISEQAQPSNQQFENDLFHALSVLDPLKTIWIENESKSTGKVQIPDEFWLQMKAAALIQIEVPLDTRVRNLVAQYVDKDDTKDLIISFKKIERKLGGKNLSTALKALEQGDFNLAAKIALTYYDKSYNSGMTRTPPPFMKSIPLNGESTNEAAKLLIKEAQTLWNEMNQALSG